MAVYRSYLAAEVDFAALCRPSLVHEDMRDDDTHFFWFDLKPPTDHDIFCCIGHTVNCQTFGGKRYQKWHRDEISHVCWHDYNGGSLIASCLDPGTDDDCHNQWNVAYRSADSTESLILLAMFLEVIWGFASEGFDNMCYPSLLVSKHNMTAHLQQIARAKVDLEEIANRLGRELDLGANIIG